MLENDETITEETVVYDANALIHQLIPAEKRNDFKSFLQYFGLNIEDLAHEGIDLASFAKLWKIEFTFRNYLRWCYLDFLIERVLHYPAIGTQDLRASSEISTKKDHRLWIGGRGLPLKTLDSLRRNYAITGFKRGFELVLYEGTHLFIFGLSAFQLVQGVRFDRIHNILEFLKNFFNGDEKVIVATLGVLQSPSARWTTLGILSLPILGGIINAIVHANKSKELVKAELEKLDRYFSNELPQHRLWWHEYLKPLIPIVSLFNPVMSRLGKLELLLRWDGRLSPMMLRKALGYLKQIAQNEAYFFSRIEALRVLARIAQGLSLRQFDLLQEGFRIENQLLRLALKTEALRILHEISIERQGYDLKIFSGIPKDKNIKLNAVYLYLKDPETLEYANRNQEDEVNRVILTQEEFGEHYEAIVQTMKTCRKLFNPVQREALDRVLSAQGIFFGKKGLKSLILSLCAHYYKWTLADSNAYSISATMLIAKLIKTGLSLLIFKTFFSAIKEYLSCPGHPGVSIDGEELPWTTSFSEKCLETYISLFNLLPGQPAYTLTDKLSHFKTQWSGVLDLSYKNLNGTIVSQILKGFGKNGLKVTRLNLTANRLDSVESVEALFSEPLSEIESLDLSATGLGGYNVDKDDWDPDISISLAKNLYKLSSLKQLILSHNNIFDTGSMAIFNNLCILNQTMTYLDITGLNINIPNNNTLNCLMNLRTLLLPSQSSGEGEQGFLSNLPYYQNLHQLKLSLFSNSAIDDFINGLNYINKLDVLEIEISETFINQEALIGNLTILENLHILTFQNGLQYFSDENKLIESFLNMPSLKKASIAPIHNITDKLLSELKTLGIQSNLPIVNSTPSAKSYLSSLSSNLIFLDLSGRLIGINPDVLGNLLQGLSQFTHLEGLVLSGNSFSITQIRVIYTFMAGLYNLKKR